MCTVTYIPTHSGFYLTSNRDERHTRVPAEKPMLYEANGSRIIYPKDQNAKGTWIALKNNGDAVCLLNGALEAHKPQPPYRKSRGLILLDIALQTDMANTFNESDLQHIEPFTLVVVQQKKLYECRWDANQKFFMELNSNQPHIWSSCTLYPLATRLRRKQWFDDWLNKMTHPSPAETFQFHLKSGDGDLHNDLVMNRGNDVFTVSITGVFVEEDSIKMQYFDLVKNEITNIDFKQNLQFC